MYMCVYIYIYMYITKHQSCNKPTKKPKLSE